ncbi:tail protein [Pseudoalteromonas luteoviolacea CPMOR-1]|uniref:Tail protein n=1 Tax=Pseudoalteromonas luteoviolacea CPMOR-1 TaxID=1365248 RepID=A0A167GZN0_9GAMM|nr:tail protein X [Pseudoalteromonas luteoviolacea]KZN57474.1 tail protein [Pseudoalteromonas luteoviolacea CPMOR-1]
MKYRSKQGERLDQICYTHYGHLNGTVEAVYKANLDLVLLPCILPLGTLIVLPEIVQQYTQTNSIKLWD